MVEDIDEFIIEHLPAFYNFTNIARKVIHIILTTPTCGRWCSVSDSLPAYGAICSAVGRADDTALNWSVV
jgi:hypothetical protein